MGISRKGKIAFAALAVAAMAIVAIASGSRRKTGDEIRKVPVNLNETLTNEMSDTSVLAGFDDRVINYMTQWGLKGVSLSVMRNDSLLYAKCYGIADNKQPIQPGNILRSASVA